MPTDAMHARIRDSNSFGSDCDDTAFADLDLDASILSALDDDFEEEHQTSSTQKSLVVGKQEPSASPAVPGFAPASSLLLPASPGPVSRPGASPSKPCNQRDIAQDIKPGDLCEAELDDFDLEDDLELLCQEEEEEEESNEQPPTVPKTAEPDQSAGMPQLGSLAAKPIEEEFEDMIPWLASHAGQGPQHSAARRRALARLAEQVWTPGLQTVRTVLSLALHTDERSVQWSIISSLLYEKKDTLCVVATGMLRVCPSSLLTKTRLWKVPVLSVSSCVFGWGGAGHFSSSLADGGPSAPSAGGRNPRCLAFWKRDGR